MTRRNLIPSLEALFTVLVWGASFIATKITLRSAEPVTVVWLRFAIGTLVLGGFVLARKQFSLPSRKELLLFSLLGLMGVTFHHWVQATGLETSQAGTASWIISATPVFIALFSWILLRENLGWLGAGGIALAAFGVLLVVSRGDLPSLWKGKAFGAGDLLLLTNPPNWALFSVISRRVLRTHSPALMMLYVMGLGWLFTTPLFLLGPGFGDIQRLTQEGWLALAFLGILCTGLGYIFWYDALEAMPATQVGAFQYIQPLVTLVVGVLVLSEPILPGALVGGATILFGVWLVNRENYASAARSAGATNPK